MSAVANDVAAMTYVSSEAVACTVMASDGTGTYLVIVAEEEGYALVRPCASEVWVQIAIVDLDLLDTDDFDALVAAVIEHGFGQAGRGQ